MQLGIPGFDVKGKKRCPRCKLVRSLTEFNTRLQGKNRTPSAYCRECQRDYCRQHYRRNAVEHNKRRYIHQKEYLIRNRLLMDSYLATQACVDCGNTNPVVLEFDHVRGNKRYDISTMARSGFSWHRILQEIAKCEVRCANCHRIRTASQGGWKGRATAGMKGEANGR